MDTFLYIPIAHMQLIFCIVPTELALLAYCRSAPHFLFLVDPTHRSVALFIFARPILLSI